MHVAAHGVEGAAGLLPEILSWQPNMIACGHDQDILYSFSIIITKGHINQMLLLVGSISMIPRTLCKPFRIAFQRRFSQIFLRANPESETHVVTPENYFEKS